jgi:hypothetical protein
MWPDAALGLLDFGEYTIGTTLANRRGGARRKLPKVGSGPRDTHLKQP